MINRRRSGARGTPAKVNATAGLEASEGVNSASVSDGSHESVYLGPFYVLTPFCRSFRTYAAHLPALSHADWASKLSETVFCGMR